MTDAVNTPPTDTQGEKPRTSIAVTPAGQQVEALLDVVKQHFDVHGDPSINIAALVADLWAALDARPVAAATHTDPAAEQAHAAAPTDAAAALERVREVVAHLTEVADDTIERLMEFEDGYSEATREAAALTPADHTVPTTEGGPHGG